MCCRLCEIRMSQHALQPFNATFNYQFFDSRKSARIILRNAFIPDMGSILGFFRENLAAGVVFWTIDFRLNIRISSSGLAAIIAMHKAAADAGGGVIVVYDPNSEIGKFLKFIQLEQLVPTVEESTKDIALSESITQWPIYSAV
jgi:hypothetical protein